MLVNINNTDVIKNSLGDDSLNELYRLISARLQQYIIELDLSVIAVKSADHEFMLAYLTPHEYDYHKLIHVFYESFKLHNDDVLITVNLGYLNRPFAPAKLQEAYTQASIALSAARKQGENTGVAYDKTLDANVGLSTQILTHLNYALEQDELYLHYQPIIALDSERIIGAEVLIRWQSPILGFVSPAQFIPIAEKSGLILPLGSWVLQQACHAVAHKIREQHWPANFELHVNLSVRQLMQADFVQRVTQCLHDAGLPATNLTLEITESMLIENLSFIDERLRELRQHGIRIAIDDFGTGYSSLSHLYKLSFDCLKVDRIFVSGLLDSQNCAAVLNSVVQLAHGFNVPMVAEGVEKREEAELLRKMGAQKRRATISVAQFLWNNGLSMIRQDNTGYTSCRIANRRSIREQE
ncbi:EAL domain-containing protein [Plesiomonas shigelloides subsp. oncorhynchi]|nr:EAL domain-containing protein [Plesiomonas shigelloides]